jgi:hypothetical protein
LLTTFLSPNAAQMAVYPDISPQCNRQPSRNRNMFGFFVPSTTVPGVGGINHRRLSDTGEGSADL